jgi:hypothetical protein
LKICPWKVYFSLAPSFLYLCFLATWGEQFSSAVYLCHDVLPRHIINWNFWNSESKWKDFLSLYKKGLLVFCNPHGEGLEKLRPYLFWDKQENFISSQFWRLEVHVWSTSRVPSTCCVFTWPFFVNEGLI